MRPRQISWSLFLPDPSIHMRMMNEWMLGLPSRSSTNSETVPGNVDSFCLRGLFFQLCALAILDTSILRLLIVSIHRNKKICTACADPRVIKQEAGYLELSNEFSSAVICALIWN